MRRSLLLLAALLWVGFASEARGETPLRLYGLGSLGYDDVAYGLGSFSSRYRSEDEALNAHLESLLGDDQRTWLHWNAGGNVLHSSVQGSTGSNDDLGWGYDVMGRAFPDRSYPLTLSARRDLYRATGDYFPPQDLLTNAYEGNWVLAGGTGSSLPRLRLRGDTRDTTSGLNTINLSQQRAGLDLYRSAPGLSFAGNFNYDDWRDRLSGYRQTLRSLAFDESGRLADRTQLYAVGGMWDQESLGKKSSQGNLLTRLVHYPKDRFQGTALYGLTFNQAEGFLNVEHRGELGGDLILGSGIRTRDRVGLGRTESSAGSVTASVNSLSNSTGVTLQEDYRPFSTLAAYDFTIARSVGGGSVPRTLTPSGLGYAATTDGGSTVLSHRVEGALERVRTGRMTHELRAVYLQGDAWEGSRDGRRDVQAFYQGGIGGLWGSISLSAGSAWWYATEQMRTVRSRGRTDQANLWSNGRIGRWTASLLLGGSSQESATTGSSPTRLGAAHWGAGISGTPLANLLVAANVAWTRTLWPSALKGGSFSYLASAGYALRSLSLSAQYSSYDETGAVRRKDQRFMALLTRSFDEGF